MEGDAPAVPTEAVTRAINSQQPHRVLRNRTTLSQLRSGHCRLDPELVPESSEVDR